jgi:hypothetical protein
MSGPDASVRVKDGLQSLRHNSRWRHVEPDKPPLRALKLLGGLALTARGAQQSDERSLGGPARRLDQAERPCVWQGLVRAALKACD